MDVTGSFLAGSILSLILPLAQLAGDLIWLVAVQRRRIDET
jgi:hypothetical protein